MIFAIKLKKCVVDASILIIIIGKLCYKKKSCRIILLKIDKDSEIGFYYTILLFSLAICLQIKSGKEFLLNA